LNFDPSSREDVAAWLALTLVRGVSPRAQRQLLAHFGSPHTVRGASPASVAAVCGNEIAERMERGADAALVDATMRWLGGEGHHLVSLADAAYPRALLELPDPPTVLYACGRVELLNARAFAIVGSRNATLQGARDAEAFARALSAADYCIVSGLAAGIDAAAHRGGLAERGSSVAIMGTGVDQLYPPRNRALGEDLARNGCLVSEFPWGTPPNAGNFPRRNRLISGMSRGVLVVEAALESGSLITAKTALEQGRDVFAIPGSIHSPLSKGCHELIKQGAKLVESAQDILGELGWHGAAATQQPSGKRAAAEPLLAAMGFAPISMDGIAQLTGEHAGVLAAALTRLEVEGHVAALAGGMFQRVERAS
jgi:DNA processing protein